MSIHERIIEARVRAGMSQTDLATALGITPQAVSMWESGKNTPRGSRLREIAKALGVSESYLLSDNESAAGESSQDEEKRSHLQIAGELADQITSGAKKGRLERDDLLALEHVVARLLQKGE